MLAIYVITFDSSDFRGQAVLRRHVWRGSSFVADWSPLATGSAVSDVRRFLPPQAKRMPLTPVDDPVIKEWYA